VQERACFIGVIPTSFGNRIAEAPRLATTVVIAAVGMTGDCAVADACGAVDLPVVREREHRCAMPVACRDNAPDPALRDPT